jgi:pyruvate dehydrogenase E1 component beta subunit
VVFLEHMALYRQAGTVPELPEAHALGSADIARPGRDVTIVCIGQQLGNGLAAADDLARDGIEAEVINLRSLNPIDLETLRSSLGRTHRMVIAEEAPPRCSVAADIASTLSQLAWSDLWAPIATINSRPTPVPFSPPLEDAWLPSSNSIRLAAEATIRLKR